MAGHGKRARSTLAGGTGGLGGDGGSPFEFDSPPSWQRRKQSMLGSDLVILEPLGGLTVDRQPTQLDFELQSVRPFLFGPMSKFQISGGFEFQKEDEVAWNAVPLAHRAAMALAPNWFEMLVKSVDIFVGNVRITASDESRFIQPWLHAMLYRFMHPTAKKLLCPQPQHPAYCVPDYGKDAWGVTSAAWLAYAEKIFTANDVDFDWVPLHFWPLFQNANHMFDGQMPKAVPMPLVGKLHIRVVLHDTQDAIFRQLDTNKNKYRFSFDKFRLVIEEARLSYPFERSLLASKKMLAYPGVTRLQLVEPISEGTATYRTRFQEVFLPEGLVVFALPKTVSSGQYSFAKGTERSVFLPHNIDTLEISFDQKRFNLKEPNLGQFGAKELEAMQYYNHVFRPMFGMAADADGLTIAALKDGGKDSAYPHIFVPLTVLDGDGRSRIVPALDDGSCLPKRADLDIFMRFGTDGSTSGAVYVVYAYYTDVNLMYDPKNKFFLSPYGVVMN